MKKIIKKLIVLCFVLLLTAGCSGGNSSLNEQAASKSNEAVNEVYQNSFKLSDFVKKEPKNFGVKKNNDQSKDSAKEEKSQSNGSSESKSENEKNVSVCPDCGGLKDCPECFGSGDCFECDGSGYVHCFDCLGDGECLNCNGDGGYYDYVGSDTKWVRCSVCRGKGLCNSCKGITEVKCTDCYGKGSCKVCRGTTICPTCNGTGEVKGTSQSQSKKNNSESSSSSSSKSKSEDSKKTSEVSDGRNIATATINGEEVIFYLKETYIADKTNDVYVIYLAVNPRGEQLYHLTFWFDANLTEGSYDMTKNFTGSVANVKLYAGKYAAEKMYASYGNYRTKEDTVVGNFTIDKMSSDWLTYDGHFSSEVFTENNSSSFTLSDFSFNFTLYEIHPQVIDLKEI